MTNKPTYFTIDNTEIRFIRSFADLFNGHNFKITNETKFININQGKKLLGFTEKFPDSDFIEVLKLYEEKLIQPSKLRRYINDINEENFSIIQYKIYLAYTKINGSDSQSDNFLRAKFGDQWKKYSDLNKKNLSRYYDKEHIMQRFNLTEEEALQRIADYKKKKATSLEGFIKRWGEEEGQKKWDKFQLTSKHTLEKYVERYGEDDGKVKWDEYCEKKRVTSPRTIDYWINKGLTSLEAETERKKFHKTNSNTFSLDFWVSKGLTKEVALEKIESINSKKRVNFARASKQSMKFFKRLTKFLDDSLISYRIGHGDNTEMFIYHEEEKRLYFYDFFIPSLRMVVEYNGEKYHPNPKMTNEEWQNWRSVGYGVKNPSMSADEKFLKDKIKKELAQRKKLDYYEVWSSDNLKQKAEKIISIIKRKIDENQENQQERN